MMDHAAMQHLLTATIQLSSSQGTGHSAQNRCNTCARLSRMQTTRSTRAMRLPPAASVGNRCGPSDIQWPSAGFLALPAASLCRPYMRMPKPMRRTWPVEHAGAGAIAA